MTVTELIDALRDYPGEAVVRFAYPARDYARSTLAREVTGLEPGTVEHSEYHDEHVLVHEGLMDGRDDDDEDREEALILS